jgi:hypothetical protein
MKKILPLLAFAALGLSTQVASATVYISDNFTNTVPETPSLNWTGDGIFNPVPGTPVSNGPSVDLVSPGTWPTLVPNAANSAANPQLIGLNAVDLDGSTGTGFTPAGTITSTTSLALGNYVVNFYLAGNLRNVPGQEVQVSVGADTVTLNPNPIPNNMGYTLYSLAFYNVSGTVSFTDLGPATQQGALLTDVTVSSVLGGGAPGTPEPSTWAMIILGFLGIGLVSYRRRGGLSFRIV